MKKKEDEWLVLLLLLLLFLLKNLPIIIPSIKPKKKNGDGTVPPEPEPIPYVPPSPDPIPKVDITPRRVPSPQVRPVPSPQVRPVPSPQVRRVPLPQVRRFIEDEKRYERNVPAPKATQQPIQTTKRTPGIDPWAIAGSAAVVGAAAAIKFFSKVSNPAFGVLPLFNSRKAIVIRRMK